jgi:hypothetical protein
MIQQTATHDTILDEIHQTRRAIAEKFGGDIAAMLEDARKRQAAAGRAIWQGPKSQPALTPAEIQPALGRQEDGSSNY